MADKKNIVPSPLTLAVLGEHIANVSLQTAGSLFFSRNFSRDYEERLFSLTYRGEVQQYDEDDDLVYILYFKDRVVFSLNATGAFSDGIIRAVS